MKPNPFLIVFNKQRPRRQRRHQHQQVVTKTKEEKVSEASLPQEQQSPRQVNSIYNTKKITTPTAAAIASTTITPPFTKSAKIGVGGWNNPGGQDSDNYLATDDKHKIWTVL
jgi:hypothetical protein